MDLTIGDTYFIVSDYTLPEILTIADFDALKECVYLGIDEDDCPVFRPVVIHWKPYYTVKDGNYMIFKSVDSYLVDLVTGIFNVNETVLVDEENLKYKFDDFFKNKIKESQEKHPEAWV